MPFVTLWLLPLRRSADARASNAIFDQNNPDPTARRSIDLHGLHVEEAKSQLTKLLNFHQARASLVAEHG